MTRLLGFFKQSSIIKGFGSLRFDYIIVKNKQFVTYIVAKDLGFLGLENAALSIPEKTLKSWDRVNNLFGPIPLSLVVFAGEDIYAKRLSFKWQADYSKAGQDRLIPSTGLKKL